MARKNQIDTNTIVIERGIPLPEPRNQTHSWLSIIRSMEVGDSFVVPNKKVANNLYNYFCKSKMGCTAREIEAGFYRVWRVK